MDLKSILKVVTSPYALGPLAAGLGYMYLGRGKEGYKPYVYTGLAGVAGALSAYAVQHMLGLHQQVYVGPAPAAATVPAATATQATSASSGSITLDTPVSTIPAALPDSSHTTVEEVLNGDLGSLGASQGTLGSGLDLDSLID